MRACAFLNEIAFADEVPPVSVNMQYTRKFLTVGDIDVWHAHFNDQPMIFFKDGNIITTYVILSANMDGGFYHVNRMFNSGTKGSLTTLFSIILNDLGDKLMFHNTEQLTPDGLHWLIGLIKSGGRGFAIVDQTGVYPDAQSLEKEWEECMIYTRHNGGNVVDPTSIFISK